MFKENGALFVVYVLTAVLENLQYEVIKHGFTEMQLFTFTVQCHDIFSTEQPNFVALNNQTNRTDCEEERGQTR